MKLLPRKLLEMVAERLPARNIKHGNRPYLRRYYLGTIFGVRFYIHHFVGSDPDGLHNHPWRFGGSVVLNGYYFEERRFCLGTNARRISLLNWVHGDTLHRVIVPTELEATHKFNHGGFDSWIVAYPWLGVWTLFWHTRKIMPWATIKDKGGFKQYHEETPTHSMTNGHSDWWRTAPKGKQLFPGYEVISYNK